MAHEKAKCCKNDHTHRSAEPEEGHKSHHHTVDEDNTLAGDHATAFAGKDDYYLVVEAAKAEHPVEENAFSLSD